MLAYLLMVAMVAGFRPAAAQTGEEKVLESVPPATFKQNMEAHPGTLLDVRTPEEFQEGHLVGATNMNFFDEDFKQKIEALPKNDCYFVYCRSGNRSGKTLEIMRQSGFQRVYDMSGGFLKWSSEGLPTEK